MVLERIVKAKRREVASRKEIVPLSRLREAMMDLPPPRDFMGAINRLSCSIIAEVKKRSPSKGKIRGDFDPLKIAALYQENGAAAVSVLTDEEFFGGNRTHLAGIKEVVDLPLLRKDFIIDPYQIYETRVLGGDALLLIAFLLEGQLKEYIRLTQKVGLAALVEVHTREELNKAVAADAEIIGINNRDLKTFSTDLRTTLELAPFIPEDRIVVSESGINTREDIEALMQTRVHSFLVGEALMRAEDIGGKLRELLGRGRIEQ
jgi:indole-3-glycerol phosphate synthase